MKLKYRKKRPLNRDREHFKDTKLFIIATEGSDTEKQYFEIFNSTRVQVIIVESINGRSAPQYVLDRLVEISKEFDFGEGDEFWLMIDVDRWGRRRLAEVARLVISKGWESAISNPCFEVWLLMHFANPEDNSFRCKDVVRQLKSEIGSYGKSRLAIDVFKPHYKRAIHMAKERDEGPNDRWPQNINSYVYKVVENILEYSTK